MAGTTPALPMSRSRRADLYVGGEIFFLLLSDGELG